MKVLYLRRTWVSFRNTHTFMFLHFCSITFLAVLVLRQTDIWDISLCLIWPFGERWPQVTVSANLQNYWRQLMCGPWPWHLSNGSVFWGWLLVQLTVSMLPQVTFTKILQVHGFISLECKVYCIYYFDM